jgi:hypothetical protein
MTLGGIHGQLGVRADFGFGVLLPASVQLIELGGVLELLGLVVVRDISSDARLAQSSLIDLLE